MSRKRIRAVVALGLMILALEVCLYGLMHEWWTDDFVILNISAAIAALLTTFIISAVVTVYFWTDWR